MFAKGNESANEERVMAEAAADYGLRTVEAYRAVEIVAVERVVDEGVVIAIVWIANTRNYYG